MTDLARPGVVTYPESRRIRRPSQRALRWWIATSSMAIAVIAPLPYLISSLDDLARDDNQIATSYAGRPGWVQVAFYAHVCFGGLAMLVTPVQLSSLIRARRASVHRTAGKIALVSIFVASIAGAILAPFSVADGVGFAGFGLLAVAWFTCAAMSYVTIRRGDWRAHRRWAIRTFALTYAAVTLRLWLGLLIPLQIAIWDVNGDLAFDRAYHLVPFLAWVPNLLLAERYLQRQG